MAALLQGTVEALLFGGGGAAADAASAFFGAAGGGGSGSSGSASGRVPDAFWPPEMSAEAPHDEQKPAAQQQQRSRSAPPPPAWELQPQPAAPAWPAAAEDTPSPDGSASSGGSDVAEGEAAEDPVVAALLARIAACRAELRYGARNARVAWRVRCMLTRWRAQSAGNAVAVSQGGAPRENAGPHCMQRRGAQTA